MQRLEVSGAVRPIYKSLGVKALICDIRYRERVQTARRSANCVTQGTVSDCSGLVIRQSCKMHAA